MIKYKDTFIQNGFEDIETILELNEDYLESLGMPLGHKLKIMKRIRELRSDEEDGPSTVSQTYANEGVSTSTDMINSKLIALNMQMSKRTSTNRLIGCTKLLTRRTIATTTGRLITKAKVSLITVGSR